MKIYNILSSIISKFVNVERKDLLWTNTTPENSFAAQTINLDLSEYDSVFVNFRKHTSSPQYVNFTQLVGKGGTCTFLEDSSYASQEAYSRQITVNVAGVAFTNTYRKAVTSTAAGRIDNTQLIPTEIYGTRKAFTSDVTWTTVPSGYGGGGSGSGVLSEINNPALETLWGNTFGSGAGVNNFTNVYKQELIWENASPANDFGEQTISLDLSNYDFILYLTTDWKIFMIKANTSTQITSLVQVNYSTPANSVYAVVRNISVTPIGITLGAGNQKRIKDDVQSVSNSRLKPITIYGIKPVLAP